MLDHLMAGVSASGFVLETLIAIVVVLAAASALTTQFTFATIARRRAKVEAHVAYLAAARPSAAPFSHADHRMRASFASALHERDAQQIIDDLFNEMNANIAAGNEVVQAWNELIRGDIRDDRARQEFARTAKRAGAKLSTRVWDRHGDVFLHSGLPADVKSALRRLYEATRRLKQTLASMSSAPSLQELQEVSAQIDDMIEAVENLHAAFERHAR